MIDNRNLYRFVLSFLTQEEFDKAVTIFERDYLENEVSLVNGPGDGGCDLKRFKNGKELLQCVQITIQKNGLSKKLTEDLAKVKKLIDEHGYSPSFDFYCSLSLADEKINEYRDLAKRKFGIEINIYDANRLSQFECMKFQEYLISFVPKLEPSFDQLKKHLSDQLLQTRKNHPSFKLMEIDDSLFPDSLPEYHITEAHNDKNEKKTVSEIVSESWIREEKNHLMIEGEGGIGKTVTLLSLPEKFVPREVPAVYIQLHRLKVNKGGGKGNAESVETIQEYLKSQIFFNDDALFNQFEELTRIPWDKGPQVLMLLDGFNEIPADGRWVIGEEINRWAGRPGVQIITSSRYDIHSYVPLSDGYGRILLQPLSREIIEEFLTKAGVPHPTAESQWNIINFPLMLTLYAQTEKVMGIIDKDEDLQDFKLNNSAGSIIWNYLQREVWRYRKNAIETVKCVISAEFIAPYIAWKMQKDNTFFLDKRTFQRYVHQACQIAVELPKEQFRDHIANILFEVDGALPATEAMFSFLKKDLRLFVDRGETFSLMHQQFRDALAALHLINVSYFQEELPKEWETTVDYYVMEFVSELASQDEADMLWEKNRKNGKQCDAATINMLELQKRKRNYDFSALNFSGLNLQTISLFPYRMPGRTILQLPHRDDMNAGMLLSDKSFYPEGHTSSIRRIAITQDGKKCVSGAGDNTLRIWDIEQGHCLKKLEGHSDWIWALAITRDGKRCVSGSLDKTLRIWDIESGECLKKLEGHRGRIFTLAICPDGEKCVSGADDNTIRIWDMRSGQCLKTLEGHSDWIRTLAITPDGKRCVSGADDKNLRIWDIEQGQCIKTLRGHTSVINALAISPDGKKCTSGSNDKTIRIWDIEQGQCIKTLRGHTSVINALAISPDGRKCASGSNDETIRIWDMHSGHCLETLKGHRDCIRTLAITPDGKRCVSGADDNTLRIWDIEKGQCLNELEGHSDWIWGIAITQNGKRCVSCADDKTLRIWDMESGMCIMTLNGRSNWIRAIAITPDGKRCVSSTDDNILRVWDLEEKKCLLELVGHCDRILSLAISSDGKRCVSGSWDKTIRIWDIEVGRCLKTLEGHKGRIFTLAVYRDGERCISGADDNTIRVWDLDRGQCLKEHEGPSDWIKPLAIMPDGKKYVIGTADNTICVCDIEQGQCIKTLKGHTRVINSLAISKDGCRCVSGGYGKTIRIWDMKSEQCIKSLKGHTRPINSLAIFPTENKCISGSSDGTLRIWDMDTEQCVKILEGHKGKILALAISRDGTKVVSGSNDETIRIWDLQSYQFKTIQVLPLSLIGIDFSKSIVSPDLPDLKETLRQNGAII